MRFALPHEVEFAHILRCFFDLLSELLPELLPEAGGDFANFCFLIG